MEKTKQKEDGENEKKTNDRDPKTDFETMVEFYLAGNPHLKKMDGKISELEVRFGTNTRLSRPISKIDYDNVVKRILSDGFKHSTEETLLRIFPLGGSVSNDRIRIELNGIGNVSEYCKLNRLTNMNGDYIAKIIEKKDLITDLSKLFESSDMAVKNS
jgi:hypothetical protein